MCEKHLAALVDIENVEGDMPPVSCCTLKCWGCRRNSQNTIRICHDVTCLRFKQTRPEQSSVPHLKSRKGGKHGLISAL